MSQLRDALVRVGAASGAGLADRFRTAATPAMLTRRLGHCPLGYGGCLDAGECRRDCDGSQRRPPPEQP